MSGKLSLREIEDELDGSFLPDDEDAEAVLMDDILDSDESSIEIYCISGHFFYPRRGSSLEQRAFDHLVKGHDEPLSVSFHECLICMRQASEGEVNSEPSVEVSSPREEMLNAIAENENVNWR